MSHGAERNTIPNPLCERIHDSDVRYESPSIALFSPGHQFRYRAQKICVRTGASGENRKI